MIEAALDAGDALAQVEWGNIFQTFLPNTLQKLQSVTESLAPSGSYYDEMLNLGVSLPPEGLVTSGSNGRMSSSSISCGSSISTNLIMICFFVDLLKVPIRLNVYPALPEVYAFDGQRLSEIRDDIDIIVLLASIGISIKQIVVSLRPSIQMGSSGGRDAKNSEETLFHRLDILVRQHVSGEGVKLIDSLITEATRYVEQLLERNVRDSLEGAVESRVGASGRVEATIMHISSGTGKYCGDSWKFALRKAIENNTTSTSPVMGLFAKRVYELLMRGLIPVFTSSSTSPALGPIMSKYSMQSAQQASAMRTLIDRSKLLLNHHTKVHSSTYSTMLQLIGLRAQSER